MGDQGPPLMGVQALGHRGRDDDPARTSGQRVGVRLRVREQRDTVGDDGGRGGQRTARPDPQPDMAQHRPSARHEHHRQRPDRDDARLLLVRHRVPHLRVRPAVRQRVARELRGAHHHQQAQTERAAQGEQRTDDGEQPGRAAGVQMLFGQTRDRQRGQRQYERQTDEDTHRRATGLPCHGGRPDRPGRPPARAGRAGVPRRPGRGPR